MGAANSRNQIQKINLGEWMNIGIENDAEIVKSNLGKGQGQIRIIPLDPKNEINKQAKIYSYRKNTDLPLVKCYGVQFNKSQSKNVCGNLQVAKVLTQRIPKRLSNINSISFPESLYVLSDSLVGFQDLHGKAGKFQINDNMIGFTKDGKVKVWLNENFAVNHPNFERPTLQTTVTTDLFAGQTSQQKMVKTLINLIQRKCQPKGYPRDFENSVNQSKTFQEAFHKTQKYIEQKNINIIQKIGQTKPKQQKNNTNRITLMTNQRNTHTINQHQSVIVNNGYTTVNSQNNEASIKNNVPTFSALSQPILGQFNNYLTQNQVIYRVSPPKNYNSVNISTGRSAGLTYINQPYRFGVSSPIVPPTTTLHKPTISFSYLTPKPSFETSQVVKYH